MNRLLIATRNRGKLREIREILKDAQLEIVGLDDVNFSQEMHETGNSFEDNAVIKAQTAGKSTGILTMGEDSGLEVDALNGRPGIKSARYAIGSDLDRINKVLQDLKGVPKDKRTARFRAVVALYDPQKNKTYTFEGISKGSITGRPQGTNGFGYDPIFYNFDLGKTNGEATIEEKNRVSHRARALMKAKNLFMKPIY